MVYHPRGEAGVVRRIAEHFAQPTLLADQIERSLGTTQVNDDGTESPATVMVLASCGYMIDPIRHELRRRGIPFHNPYRRSRGDWNPMRPGGKNRVTSAERLLAYLMLDEREDGGVGPDLARPWTVEDMRQWTHVIGKRGIFRRGALAVLDDLEGEVPYETIAGMFLDDVELEQAVTPDVGWFERNLLAAAVPGMAFPLGIVRARGARALLEQPRVILGTIHSVKGGQATCVYLLPDLSTRGQHEWAMLGGPADGVRRLMYVGMTRARRELALCSAATPLHVSPEQMCAGARRDAA
jgi:superfamily I DNA/RNA helicase